MSTSSIYLTGGTIDPAQLSQYTTVTLSSSGSADWRTFAMTRLQNHGVRVINPLEMAWSEVDFSDAIDLTGSADQRIKWALDLIDQSDGLLANLERPSYATAMEMFYAHRRGKMVTVVGPAPFNPWVTNHSQARFSELDQALQYIIGQHPHSPPSDWAIQFESQLAERYEQLPPSSEPDYKFLGGTKPVLVLAPHATAYFREGEFHEQESFTGSMAALMNRMTGCHSLVSNYCLAADPCWYLETPFRRVFTDIVKAGGVGLVVMLLGSTWLEAPAVQISSYGPSSSTSASSSFTSAHEDYEKRLKFKLCELDAVGGRAFDHYLSPLANFAANELNLPVVIVRLHKRYRMPKLQALHFIKATELLASFVKEAGDELAKAAG